MSASDPKRAFKPGLLARISVQNFGPLFCYDKSVHLLFNKFECKQFFHRL